MMDYGTQSKLKPQFYLEFPKKGRGAGGLSDHHSSLEGAKCISKENPIQLTLLGFCVCVCGKGY